MDRSLNSLDFRFKNTAIELLARLVEYGIPVVIVNTRRTEEEQKEMLARNVSWTAHSKHQDGLAIDVCPIEQFTLHGEEKLQWDAQDPVWEGLGAVGEALGLVWGGRWKIRDLGHFEWVSLADRVKISGAPTNVL